PVRSTASAMARTPSSLVVSGFSTTTSAPPSSAATTKPAWVKSGEVTMTRWTRCRAIAAASSAGSKRDGAATPAAASRDSYQSSLPWLVSAQATSSATSACGPAMASRYIWAREPAPTSAYRIRVFIALFRLLVARRADPLDQEALAEQEGDEERDERDD